LTSLQLLSFCLLPMPHAVNDFRLQPSDASGKDESAQFARVELFAASTAAAASGDAGQEQTDGAAEDGTADEGEGDEDGSDGDRRRR
jgi:hypothetical protein